MKKNATEPSSSFLRTAKAIFWAFFGVRRRQHGEFDAANLKPVQIVAAGIMGGAVFVLVLLLVVRMVVLGHGATS